MAKRRSFLHVLLDWIDALIGYVATSKKCRDACRSAAKSKSLGRLVAIFCALSVLCVSKSYAQNWNWAKPAEHQTAACKVVSEGGSGGSGALVEVDGQRFVLTCRHVVDGMTGVAEFRDGTKLRGKWLSPDSTKPDGRFDMAALAFDKPPTHLAALKLAEQDPAPGSRVEIMGFGGPKRLFRPYYGNLVDGGYDVAQNEPHQTVAAPVVHGDSGSVCVNEAGEVIGVQNVGEGNGFAGHTSDGTGYYATCGICPITPIRTFLRRVAYRLQCGPGGCPGVPAPRYRQPYGGNGGGNGGDLYPPQDQYPSRPQNPGPQNPQRPSPDSASNPLPKNDEYKAPAPSTEPTPAPLPQLDYDKLAEAIIKQGGEKLRGPAGPPGKDGVAGKNGVDGKNPDPKAIADAVSKGLPIDEIAAKAASLIDLDLVASKVVIPINPPTNSPSRRHAVLITERSKSYWDSLAVIVAKAQTRYAGIKIADKPESQIGPMPFLAVYENGVPVEQYRGLDEVARKLTEVSEGGAL